MEDRDRDRDKGLVWNDSSETNGADNDRRAFLKYCAKLGAAAPPAITLLASGARAGMGSNSVAWSGSESTTSEGLYEEPGAEANESESVESGGVEDDERNSWWGDQ